MRDLRVLYFLLRLPPFLEFRDFIGDLCGDFFANRLRNSLFTVADLMFHDAFLVGYYVFFQHFYTFQIIQYEDYSFISM